MPRHAETAPLPRDAAQIPAECRDTPRCTAPGASAPGIVQNLVSGFNRLVVCGALWLAVPAEALELDLPGNGSLSREILRAADSYDLPLGPWAGGTLPTLTVEGRVLQQAWRIDTRDLSTLEILRPIARQLSEAGFEPLFDCARDGCGGFDFRFGTRVMPSPDMFVDLFDFRFLSARAPGPEYVSVLVSRTDSAGYVQIIHVSPDAIAPPRIATDPAALLVPQEAGDGVQTPQVIRALIRDGHVVLQDLDFSTASSELGPGPYASLAALAGWLRADAGRRVALVGHTDTVGGLDPNIALSRRRATSVMRRLIDAHGVPQAQLEANGMGYLAPIAPNLTREGREANRRVEAVLLNSE